MIASLRGRLVAGVVALAAIGMLLVGGITYASQRNFLLDRVDTQLASALPAIEHEITDPGGGFRNKGGGNGPRPGGGAPTDTYGELRTETGTESEFLGPDESGEKPELPANLPLDEAITVDTSQGSYRVLAQLYPSGTVVAAIPLSDTNQTLERLLLVEAIVILGVLALIGGFALIVVRIGLLPLDRMGHTAAAIAGGDLSHRVESTDPRTEVGWLGTALNRMLDRLEEAFSARAASQ